MIAIDMICQRNECLRLRRSDNLNKFVSGADDMDFRLFEPVWFY